MPVQWAPTWSAADNNDVNASFGQAEILSIIQSMSPSILRVQPAAVREAVALVIANSADVMIIKGLHHVGTEKIDIKKVSHPAGPTVHLYCMNYTLVESGLRRPYDDLTRAGSGWRITSSSAFRGDGSDDIQGMDKSGEIDTSRTHMSKPAAQAAFKEKHYG